MVDEVYINEDEKTNPLIHEITECVEQKHEGTNKCLEEEAFGQGVMTVTGRVAEKEPSGEDEEDSLDKVRPTLVLLSPLVIEREEGVDVRFGNTGGAVGRNIEEMADDVNADRHHQQHLDGRITGLTLAGEIVIDKVPGTQKKLPKRGEEGARLEIPHLHHAVSDGIPSHPSASCRLTAAGTEVVVERSTAVGAVLCALAMVLVVEWTFLPSAESPPKCLWMYEFHGDYGFSLFIPFFSLTTRC